MEISMKAARVAAGKKQQEMADEMGIHVQTYAKMEKDPESMSIRDAKLFCRIVGVSYNKIFFVADSN